MGNFSKRIKYRMIIITLFALGNLFWQFKYLDIYITNMGAFLSMASNIILVLTPYLADRNKLYEKRIIVVGLLIAFSIGIIPIIDLSISNENETISDDGINQKITKIEETQASEIYLAESYENLSPDELERILNNGEKNFILSVDQELFDDIFYVKDFSDSDLMPEIIFEKMFAAVKTHNLVFVSQIDSITDEEFVSDKDVEKLLNEAKEISDENNINFSFSDHIKAVEKREQAYELANYFTLPRLIANGHCIIQNCLYKVDTDKAFNNGMEAINWFERALQFTENEPRIGDLYYNIATVYNNLGDTPNLEPLIREKAYKLSAVYFLFAIDNNTETYDLLDEYYAAMLFHKTAILIEESESKAFYLLKAEELYKNVTLHTDISQETLGNTYKYISDVCYKLHNLDSSLIQQQRDYYYDNYVKYREKASAFFIQN